MQRDTTFKLCLWGMRLALLLGYVFHELCIVTDSIAPNG